MIKSVIFQRATSTGLLCTFANLGGLLPAIVGPLIVTEPSGNQIDELDKHDKETIKREITSYLSICRYHFVMLIITF